MNIFKFLSKKKKQLPIILIVDDYDKYIKLLSRDFERKKQKFKVFCAKNGKIGYDLFLEIKPDIIITDIDMPLLNGYGMVNRIGRFKNTKIPIIFYSSSNIDTSKFMYAGDIKYFNKARKKHTEVSSKAIDILESNEKLINWFSFTHITKKSLHD